MGGLNMIDDLEFDTILPNAPFRELHTKQIDHAVDHVWDSLLATTAADIRLLEPLFRLRGLPAKVLGKQPPAPIGDRPALELFSEEGFVMLRQDPTPHDGRATLIFGAAGKFWSPTKNTPKRFESPEAFLAFDDPGYVKTVARFEAFSDNLGTRVETETVVAGTDAAGARKFRPYWVLIRGPSGLLRRSWLSAIDRRASSC